MNKLLVGLSLLGISASVFAGAIDYEESGTFIYGAEAFFVRPGVSDFLYADKRKQESSSRESQKVFNVEPEYHAGFHFDIAYAFPADGAQVSLGWTHLDTEDKEIRRKINFTTDIFHNNLQGNGVAIGKTKYEYNDIDLLLSKEFSYSNRYRFHPFTGLRYVHLDTTDRATYFQEGGSVDSYFKIDNGFTGVGLRSGADISVEVVDGFSLVARAAGSIIFADSNWDYHVVNVGSTRSTGIFLSKNADENTIVPEAEYRISGRFTHEFSPGTSGTLELGYLAVHYFDVIDKSDSRTGENTVGSMSDWGYEGPFIRIQFNFG